MKKAFIIYIIISIHMTAFAQTQSNTIHDVINKIELKIDSYHSNNLYAAESFAYSLLTYIQRINIYGEYSEEALERFKNVLTTDYSRFLTLFKHQNLNSCYGIQTNKYESQCIIHLYREIFKDIERIYGYEYLQALDKCKEEIFKNIVSENTLVNLYNQYRYGLIEETYYDELRLYLYVQDIHSFEELYNNILTSELSDIAKAQIALDCSDILYNYQNYNYAEHILNIWKEYNAQQEIQLNDYIERYRTQICRLSFHNKIYLRAWLYSTDVDSVIKDGNIKLHFNDINEFVRQLEIRALVDEYFKGVLNNKIKYFEFADSLITNDIRALVSGKNL